MDIRLALVAAVLPLTACAYSDAPAEPAPPPVDGLKQCNIDAVQSHVGQTATPELGARILKEAEGRTLRWGPPRSAMTMDYRSDRVNIMYDDAYKITQITCG
ncbi:MAG: hypothetical protein CVT78_06475 [Alphaproteobacteria bacterium HGW-Alphaproteobacteria-17]|nr:MAG: hypothetical protein CVT78_06475 [Alphaproteobacteria bacterium HGW-Alphaproteobacteria-17]